MAPNSLRADPEHLAPALAEPVTLTLTRDVKRLMAIRAGLAALVAGLGALAAAASGDSITLQGWLTAAAAAAAAGGAVFGVGNGPSGRQVQTDIPRHDFEALQRESRP